MCALDGGGADKIRPLALYTLRELICVLDCALFVQLHTVHITEIIDSRFVEYVGIETFVFLCKALLEGAEKLYELRYTVRTHRWTLFREVY